MFKHVIIFCSLLFSSFAFGQYYRHIDLEKEAQRLRLSEHSTWRKLIHYEEDDSQAYGVKSAIHSRNFFLHADGHINPVAELSSTILALLDINGLESKDHMQCRFPARFLWLKKVLKLKNDRLPKAECEAFTEWSMGGRIESISVVFATGYLGNPASYYGHTLLKFNSSQQAKSTNLLDVSVNYGAILPGDENPVSYIFKGIFGGYKASFSHVAYHYHTHNYGNVELRDLWEYQLDIENFDVQLIVAHSWELLGRKYTYYFLNKNCAYRMAELLEVVDDLDVLPQKNYWVLPQEIIRRIDEDTYHGKPLIKNVKFYSSRQTKFYEYYQTLNDEQKKIIDEFPENNAVIESGVFERQPLTSKHLILDTLIEYYQFVRSSESMPDSFIKKGYRTVLAKRYSLPPGESRIKQHAEKKAPHEGRAPSFFSVGIVSSQAQGNGLKLSLRPAYYDRLDADASHIANAELSMGEVALGFFGDKVNFKSITIVDIKSSALIATGLPGDNNRSWQLQFGFEEMHLDCVENCLVSRLQGDMGLSWPLLGHGSFGVYTGGAIQENKHGGGNFFPRLTAVTILPLAKKAKVLLAAEQRHHLDSDWDEEVVINGIFRYQLTTNTDIRISYTKNRGHEGAISMGYYW